MGETVNATIDVMETKVHLKVLLPGMLGMFSGLIQAALQKKGSVAARGSHQVIGHCEERSDAAIQYRGRIDFLIDQVRFAISGG